MQTNPTDEAHRHSGKQTDLLKGAEPWDALSTVCLPNGPESEWFLDHLDRRAEVRT